MMYHRKKNLIITMNKVHEKHFEKIKKGLDMDMQRLKIAITVGPRDFNKFNCTYRSSMLTDSRLWLSAPGRRAGAIFADSWFQKFQFRCSKNV